MWKHGENSPLSLGEYPEGGRGVVLADKIPFVEIIMTII